MIRPNLKVLSGIVNVNVAQKKLCGENIYEQEKVDLVDVIILENGSVNGLASLLFNLFVVKTEKTFINVYVTAGMRLKCGAHQSMELRVVAVQEDIITPGSDMVN